MYQIYELSSLRGPVYLFNSEINSIFLCLFVACIFCKRNIFNNHSPATFFFFFKFAALWTLPAAEVITLFDKSLSPFRPSLSGAILKSPWKLSFATALVWKEPQTSSWAARSDVKRSVFLKSGRATHKFWAKRWGMSEPGVTQAHQHCVITFKPLKWASQKLGSEAFHSKFGWNALNVSCLNFFN